MKSLIDGKWEVLIYNNFLIKKYYYMAECKCDDYIVNLESKHRFDEEIDAIDDWLAFVDENKITNWSSKWFEISDEHSEYQKREKETLNWMNDKLRVKYG